MAAVAAALAAGAVGVDSVQAERSMRADQARTGSQTGSPAAPGQRAGSSGVLDLFGGGGFGFGGPWRQSYKNRSGYTGAEARRRATKARNRLRARGQFRDAVR
jgi:hypothetical protein